MNEKIVGKWQIVGDNVGYDCIDMKCSNCGYTDCFEENNIYNYCPDCGAEMEGVEE